MVFLLLANPEPFPLVLRIDYVVLESKDERVFLLDESLHFRTTSAAGSVVLAWRDLSGDPGDIYKFICDPNTQPGVSHTFELVGNISVFFNFISQTLTRLLHSISMHVGTKVSQIP